MAVVISSDLVLPFSSGSGGGSGGSGSTAIPALLKKAHIGYTTVGTDTNMTANSEAAGYPVTNLSNPLTTHRWKPTVLPATVTIDVTTAQDLSFMGIASHTLSDRECVVDFQYSTNGGSSWDSLGTTGPGDNKPIMYIFEESAALWRMRITRDAGSTQTEMPSIGVFWVGQALVMERGLYQGHTPITMSRQTTRTTNRTEAGQYAGNSIKRQGVNGSYDWNNLTASWVRQYFEPFVKAVRAAPFFIAWRPGEFPDEVGFVWSTDDIKPTNSGPRDLMSVSMTVNGYSDD